LQARRAGLTRLLTVGQLSRAASAAFGEGGAHFPAQQELIDMLRDGLRGEHGGIDLRILVKGSRSSAMDKVVSALLAADEEDTGHAA